MNSGNGSRKWQFSAYKSFLTMLFALVMLLAGQATCFATNVSLQWNPDTDPNVTGYKVYYQADSSTQPFNGTGATSGASPINVQNLTSATVSGLDPNHAYYFAVSAYNASGVESPYSNIVSIPESVPPTVSLSYPANNAIASGTVSVTASASDNVGVAKVEFYVNGALQSTDTGTPYLYSWNTSALAAGTYTLMAKAYDAAGNVGQSSNVTVSVVNDTTPPTVSLTAPGNNATVSGNVPITATASDNIGVSKVEFYENGVLLSAGNVAPFNYSWNTTSVANGSYTLTAKAYDAAGNVGQAGNVTVTVNNPVADTTAPTVSISAPANSATVSGTTSVAVSASDNVGVTKVEFYVNGTLQTTDTTSPYTFSWNTTSVTNGSYTLTAKAYDAAGNVGQSANVTVTVNNYVAPPPSGTYTAVFGNASGANYPNTVQDTFLNINYDVNATNTALNTYTWPANTPANAILMKWDISALPANAQIQSATLSLYQTGSGGDSLYDMPVSEIINKSPVIANCNGYTYDGTNPWDPSSLPYNSVPLAQSDIAPVVDTPQVDTTLGYKSWNVTNIIKDWVTNSANNRGLLLNSSAKASSDSNRVFASSEATDSTQRPKLVVTYTLASDTTAPTVALSAPANGATVSGTVNVSTTASDNIGVAKVEFYVNNVLQASDTVSPYTFNWNTTALANGSYSLTAKAYDAAGNVGQTSAVTVTVNNTVADTTPPTITGFAIPATATTLTVPINTFTTSDNVGVTGFLLNESATAPSATAVGWSATPSASYTFTTAGSKTLYAWAKDAAGNVSVSKSAVVTITLPDTTPPTVAIKSPAAGSKVLSSVTIKASASDNVGVTKMVLYIDNVQKTTKSAGTLSWTWYTSSYAKGAHVITVKAYDAANNVSSTSITVNK